MSGKYKIAAYSHTHKAMWDAAVKESRNGTFLFLRNYMDYHSHRVADKSLIIYKGVTTAHNGAPTVTQAKPLCLFAASEQDSGTIAAHGGLTYGGLILPFGKTDGATVVEIFEEIAAHYRREGYKRIVYKCIPHIYHKYPCEEDVYALFRMGARLTASNLSAAIDLQEPIAFNENARRNCRKAAECGVTVDFSDDYGRFWGILSTVLHERYATAPVHTLDEIALLAKRFPENIRLVAAMDRYGKMLAGSVLYYTHTCVHAQYIAASARGKSMGALPMLFRFAIGHVPAGARYFDFGISTEDGGRYLNEGLMLQKNGMGARGIAYNIFEITL